MLQLPVGVLARARIVGDEEDRGAALAGEAEHQLDDMRAGFLVEVAGGLVGEQQLGLADHGAGEADALLFAAGERAGQMGRGACARPTSASAAAARGRGCCDQGRAASAISRVRATFSSAVSEGMRWKFWNRMPSACGGRWPSWSSLTPVIVGAGHVDRARWSRCSRPPSTISSEVLPLPEGPTMAATSPGVER